MSRFKSIVLGNVILVVVVMSLIIGASVANVDLGRLIIPGFAVMLLVGVSMLLLIISRK